MFCFDFGTFLSLQSERSLPFPPLDGAEAAANMLQMLCLNRAPPGGMRQRCTFIFGQCSKSVSQSTDFISLLEAVAVALYETLYGTICTASLEHTSPEGFSSHQFSSSSSS